MKRVNSEVSFKRRYNAIQFLKPLENQRVGVKMRINNNSLDLVENIKDEIWVDIWVDSLNGNQ
jgi:hypothetical protein